MNRPQRYLATEYFKSANAQLGYPSAGPTNPTPPPAMNPTMGNAPAPGAPKMASSIPINVDTGDIANSLAAHETRWLPAKHMLGGAAIGGGLGLAADIATPSQQNNMVPLGLLGLVGGMATGGIHQAFKRRNLATQYKQQLDKELAEEKSAFMSAANTNVANGLKPPSQTRAAKPKATPLASPIASKMPT